MSLKKIAASMHVEAKAKGKSARTLSRGLRLVLFYRRDDIVLALSRVKDRVEWERLNRFRLGFSQALSRLLRSSQRKRISTHTAQ
jgi:hypothetical protein